MSLSVDAVNRDMRIGSEAHPNDQRLGDGSLGAGDALLLEKTARPRVDGGGQTFYQALGRDGRQRRMEAPERLQFEEDRLDQDIYQLGRGIR